MKNHGHIVTATDQNAVRFAHTVDIDRERAEAFRTLTRLAEICSPPGAFVPNIGVVNPEDRESGSSDHLVLIT